MKAYEVVESGSKIFGIPVDMNPYPKVVLGEGGNKRATWIAIGRQDQEQLIEDTDKGPRILDAAVIITKEKQQPLIVSPRPGNDNRVMVLWRVVSGYRGSASITSDEAKIIASDKDWHSGRGNLGETAECLAILEPGQYLDANISGRHVQQNRARLTWTGKEIEVLFYDSASDPFQTNEEEGDYL